MPQNGHNKVGVVIASNKNILGYKGNELAEASSNFDQDLGEETERMGQECTNRYTRGMQHRACQGMFVMVIHRSACNIGQVKSCTLPRNSQSKCMKKSRKTNYE
ncbi:unnamed protein product [Ilex paraguariensis]|uniref:Uncharacterized protein n=1 Tax=Ilex paraguariensis TaxID=185542 RepID=A0ABC8S253_9AQUA